MKILNIILGENDDFLRERKVIIDLPDKLKIVTLDVPEKFKDDVERLSAYVGKEKFERGVSIEITLQELLSVVLRKRRRTDAYDALVKYFKGECDINLIIKKLNNEEKSFYYRSCA